MADTMYAWSPIQHGAERDETDPTVITSYKVVPMGATVTKDNLGVSDADFEAMVEANAIRNYPPPEMPKGYQGSVMDYLRDQLRQASQVEEAALTLAMSARGSNFAPPEEEVLMGVGAEGELNEELKKAAQAAKDEEETLRSKEQPVPETLKKPTGQE